MTGLAAGLCVGATAIVAEALVELTTGERVGILLSATLLGGLGHVLWSLARHTRRHPQSTPID